MFRALCSCFVGSPAPPKKAQQPAKTSPPAAEVSFKGSTHCTMSSADLHHGYSSTDKSHTNLSLPNNGGQNPSDSAAANLQEGVTRVVTLLQDLLSLTTDKVQPSRIMSMLCARLSVQFACITSLSQTGAYYQTAGAAFMGEAIKSPAMNIMGSSYRSLATTTSTKEKRNPPSRTSSTNSLHSNAQQVLEISMGDAAPVVGSGTSFEYVAAARKALSMLLDCDGNKVSGPPQQPVPEDWVRLPRERGLRALICVPLLSTTNSGSVVGMLTFGTTEPVEWTTQWWAPSLQLIAGWAAGALVQTRAIARTSFFDRMLTANEITCMAAAFVHSLPACLAAPSVSSPPPEVRLALVSSQLTRAVIYCAPGSKGAASQARWAPETVSSDNLEGLVLRSVVEESVDASALPSQLGTASTHDVQGYQIAHSTTSCSDHLQSYEVDGDNIEQITISTDSTLLMTVLEAGDMLIIRDALAYFGGGRLTAADLALKNRVVTGGTLIILPLIHKCRALGCVYIFGQTDINNLFSRQGWVDLSDLLSKAVFHKLVDKLRHEWYCILNEEADERQTGGSQLASGFARNHDSNGSSQGTGRISAPDHTGSPKAAPLTPSPPAAADHAAGQAGTTAAGDMGMNVAKIQLDIAALARPVSGILRASLDIANSSSFEDAAMAEAARCAGVNSGPSNLSATPLQVTDDVELQAWPELVEIVTELHRTRHTSIYQAEFQGRTVAVKVMRQHSSFPSENKVPEADVQCALLQHMMKLHHPHLVNPLLVYPNIFEVALAKGDTQQVFLTGVMPRRERHKKCIALVTEYLPHCISLREALNRKLTFDPSTLPPRVNSTTQSMTTQAVDSSRTPSRKSNVEQASRGPSGPQITNVLPSPMQDAAPPTPKPDLHLLVNILLQVATAVHYLHSHGLIHGELRPENVLCCPVSLPALASNSAPLPSLSTASVGTSNGRPTSGTAWPPHSASGLQHHIPDVSVPNPRTPPITSSGPEPRRWRWDAWPPDCTIKVKDAGMCYVGFSKGQLVIRKLLGRPRLNLVPLLAPEAFRGEKAGKAGDIYCFGLLMWELYTGDVAFQQFAGTPTKLVQTVISDGVRPQFPDGTPAWYEGLASKCWGPTPKQRPSMRRVIAQLKDIKAQLGVS